MYLTIIHGCIAFSSGVLLYKSKEKCLVARSIPFDSQKTDKTIKTKADAFKISTTLIDFLVFSINATAKFAKKQTGDVSFRYLQNLKMADVLTTSRINWIVVT